LSASSLFTPATTELIRTTQNTVMLCEAHVGQTDRQNELVFFIKPELLDVADDSKISNSLKLIEEKFAEHQVEINGAAIIPGAVLDEFGIMNRHYGFINQLSRKASELMDSDTRQQIFDHLKITDDGRYQILGGHEFLHVFQSDVNTLSEIWFAQEANKLRSGFYFIEDTFHDQPFILVNGFHPSQLAHFTRPDHRILLMLLHTNTDWKALKFDLVGDTFPERANPDSIRGMLYGDPEQYGQTDVGINTNGVHLSAGPFEAAFEVVNFFGPILDLDPAITPPLALKKAVASGFSREAAAALLKNPQIDDSDLFSATENMNTDDAVEFASTQLAA